MNQIIISDRALATLSIVFLGLLVACGSDPPTPSPAPTPSPLASARPTDTVLPTAAQATSTNDNFATVAAGLAEVEQTIAAQSTSIAAAATEISGSTNPQPTVVSVNPQAAAPFDLIASSVDENGYLLNPKWLWQAQHPGEDPPPIETLCPTLGLSCTTQARDYDPPPFQQGAVDPKSGDFLCGKPVPLVGNVLGKGNGHQNWFAVTYTGTLQFHDYSHSGPDVAHTPLPNLGGDDDYNLQLFVPDKGGLAAGNMETGEDKPAGAMWLEFDSDETIDQWNSAFWKAIHRTVDADQKPGFLSGYAIATGLLGLDTEHNYHTELHPLYALAVRSSILGPSEAWGIFVRNNGNEGMCSSHKHPVTFPNNTYTFHLPWQCNATSVTVNTDDFDKSDPDMSGPTVKTVSPSEATSQQAPGVYLSFVIPPVRDVDAPARAGINGSLGLHWVPKPQSPTAWLEWVGHPRGTPLPLNTPVDIIVHFENPETQPPTPMDGIATIETPGNVEDVSTNFPVNQVKNFVFRSYTENDCADRPKNSTSGCRKGETLYPTGHVGASCYLGVEFVLSFAK